MSAENDQMGFESFILNVKRAETPFYSILRRTVKAALTFRLPVPRMFDRLFLFVHYLQLLNFELDERIRVACYRDPTLRAMCVSVGKRLQMERIPDVRGPVKIYLDDDVRLSGQFSIGSGRVFANPEFRVGKRSFIGHGCRFAVAKSIIIGDDVLIAGDCSVSDYSAHPLDPAKRVRGEQVEPDDVRPVRIENKAWLGRGATVLPGVTIGEGAVIGAAAVVTKDVPPGHICVGNPGRLLTRTVYEPRTRLPDSKQSAGLQASSAAIGRR